MAARLAERLPPRTDRRAGRLDRIQQRRQVSDRRQHRAGGQGLPQCLPPPRRAADGQSRIRLGQLRQGGPGLPVSWLALEHARREHHGLWQAPVLRTPAWRRGHQPRPLPQRGLGRHGVDQPRRRRAFGQADHGTRRRPFRGARDRASARRMVLWHGAPRQLEDRDGGLHGRLPCDADASAAPSRRAGAL